MLVSGDRESAPLFDIWGFSELEMVHAHCGRRGSFIEPWIMLLWGSCTIKQLHYKQPSRFQSICRQSGHFTSVCRLLGLPYILTSVSVLPLDWWFWASNSIMWLRSLAFQQISFVLRKNMFNRGAMDVYQASLGVLIGYLYHTAKVAWPGCFTLFHLFASAALFNFFFSWNS